MQVQFEGKTKLIYALYTQHSHDRCAHGSKRLARQCKMYSRSLNKEVAYLPNKTKSFIHSLIHPFIHSFFHSLVRSFVRLFVCSLVRSSVHSLIE